jgi:hypothetical protein
VQLYAHRSYSECGTIHASDGLSLSLFRRFSYGITVLQTFLYYYKYSCDPLRWKILVTTVLLAPFTFARPFIKNHSPSVLDTVGMGFSMKSVYYYLVESWGRLVSHLRSSTESYL